MIFFIAFLGEDNFWLLRLDPPEKGRLDGSAKARPPPRWGRGLSELGFSFIFGVKPKIFCFGSKIHLQTVGPQTTHPPGEEGDTPKVGVGPSPWPFPPTCSCLLSTSTAPHMAPMALDKHGVAGLYRFHDARRRRPLPAWLAGSAWVRLAHPLPAGYVSAGTNVTPQISVNFNLIPPPSGCAIAEVGVKLIKLVK